MVLMNIIKSLHTSNKVSDPFRLILFGGNLQHLQSKGHSGVSKPPPIFKSFTS